MKQTSLREQFIQCMERKKAEKEKKKKPVNPVEISETAKEPVASKPEVKEETKKPVRRRRKKILDDDED